MNFKYVLFYLSTNYYKLFIMSLSIASKKIYIYRPIGTKICTCHSPTNAVQENIKAIFGATLRLVTQKVGFTQKFPKATKG